MRQLHTLTDTDWPTLPVCTQCQADIRPKQQYAIVDGLSVVCAPCLGSPAEAPAPETTGRPRPMRDRPLGAPLPAGQWSVNHERCQECGTTERKHLGRGLCTRCYSRDATRRQTEQRRAAREGAAA